MTGEFWGPLVGYAASIRFAGLSPTAKRPILKLSLFKADNRSYLTEFKGPMGIAKAC